MSAKDKCGAKTRQKTICTLRAGWGTDHAGRGKCRYHGGASKGAPKGSQNALKHGIYARLFKAGELDAAAEMAGSIDTELAIARLRLARLIEQMQIQGDIPHLEQVEEKTLASDTDNEDQQDKIAAAHAKAVAKEAARCGEWHDPDDFKLDNAKSDDDAVDESGVIERKRIFKRRDFQNDYARLTALVARLEAQRLAMLFKNHELERIIKGEKDGHDDTNGLSDHQLDTLFSELIQD